jgi:RNA polymerase sigma factor (sigma-70 family)
MTPETDDELLEQLVQGNSEVLGELFAVYESYLRSIIRSQLSVNLQSKFDSVDVVQSVWVQLLQKIGQDGCRVNDQNHLRALLVTLARRRLVNRVRRCGRASNAEVPLNEAGWDSLFDTAQALPTETAQANDLWAKMLSMTPAHHHNVLILKREGLPLQDIAARTGLHEGSVRRILRRLASELALLEEPIAPDALTSSDKTVEA